MSEQTTFISLCGLLGYGYPPESLRRGLARSPDFIGVDAGSTDPGPYYLGAGAAFVKDLQVRRDLEPALLAARRNDIPLIIGTAGGAGARPHVDHFLDIIYDLARRNDLHFKLAVIYADVDQDVVLQRLDAGRIRPCGPVPPLTPRGIRASVNLVGQMGTEPLIEALSGGADVVVAGRCCDAAIFAAVPIARGLDAGLALHCAKIAECGALCARPAGANDALIATVRPDHFVVEPADPERSCTPESVAAHSLYEQPDPTLFVEPEGTVDMSGSAFAAEGERSVRVSGTVLRPHHRPAVKLEGASLVGHRAITLAGLRDPLLQKHLGDVISSVRATVATSLGDAVAPDAYTLRFLRFGAAGEPPPAAPFAEHCEAGLVIDVVAQTQELADSVVSLARSTALHQSFPGRKATAGNLAFPFSPSDLQAGPVYEFSVYHLMDLADETLFPVHYVDV